MGNVHEKLGAIQTEIKAPKNLKNSFAGYNYRNAEGILEAVKPYLKQHNCSLVIEDDIVAVSDRVYVKATAHFVDNESKEEVTATAYAREGAEKKGLDPAQLTGATSSYARKYCLNGLLLLDDTKDADTDEFQSAGEDKPKAKPQAVKKQPTRAEAEALLNKQRELMEKAMADGIPTEFITKLYGVSKVTEMTAIHCDNALANWDKLKGRYNDAKGTAEQP